MKKMLMVLCLISCGTAWANERPNIVLMMADDLGWRDVGFNGGTTIKTPALDAMAAGGMVFERFYAAAIKDLTKAIELNPRLTKAYHNRAAAHFYRRDYDKAWADVREFQRLGGLGTDLADCLTFFRFAVSSEIAYYQGSRRQAQGLRECASRTPRPLDGPASAAPRLAPAEADRPRLDGRTTLRSHIPTK